MGVTFRAKKHILLALEQMSDNTPRGRKLEITDADLAAATDYSRRTVIRARRALMHEGVIEVLRIINRERAIEQGYFDD